VRSCAPWAGPASCYAIRRLEPRRGLPSAVTCGASSDPLFETNGARDGVSRRKTLQRNPMPDGRVVRSDLRHEFARPRCLIPRRPGHEQAWVRGEGLLCRRAIVASAPSVMEMKAMS
jgi:hypothetical protein